MKTLLLLVALAMISPVGQAQECKVEFDPKTDFTKYKTFAFGEAEIITRRISGCLQTQSFLVASGTPSPTS